MQSPRSIVHGRALPAFISFFGWASIVPTAIGMNAVNQLLACCGGSTTGAASGMIGFGLAAAAGAALMTTLDLTVVAIMRAVATSIHRAEILATSCNH